MDNPLFELIDAKKFTVEDGDTLTLTYDPGVVDPSTMLLYAMGVRDRFADDGKKVSVLVFQNGMDIAQVPDSEFEAQGFLLKERVREWVRCSMPLAYQTRMLYKFDTYFSGPA